MIDRHKEIPLTRITRSDLKEAELSEEQDELFRKLYPILEINKVVLLQTDIPKEVIDSLTDHEMFWIAQHVHNWYAYDFLKVIERIATAYVDGKGWQWEYDQGGFATITSQPSEQTGEETHEQFS